MKKLLIVALTGLTLAAIIDAATSPLDACSIDWPIVARAVVYKVSPNFTLPYGNFLPVAPLKITSLAPRIIEFNSFDL